MDSIVDLEEPLLPENGAAVLHNSQPSTPEALYQPHHNHTFLQHLTFGWVDALLQRGAAVDRLEQEDLPPLPPHLSPVLCGDLLWNTWQDEIKLATQTHRKPSLLRAVFLCFGWRLMFLAVFKLTNDALNFGGPVLLQKLLAILGDNNNSNAYGSCTGYIPYSYASTPLLFPLQASPTTLCHSSASKALIYASLLIGTLIIKAFLNAHYNYRQGLIAARLRAALISVVFRHTLVLPVSAINSTGQGRVQTLMSVDTERVLGFCIGFHDLYSLPLQIGIALWMLYRQVQISAFVGLGLVIFLLILNRYIANEIQRASITMMHAKDRRINIMTEVLRGIKAIKASAWEAMFTRKINTVRKEELHALAVKKYMDALCVYLWAATSLIFSVGTFGLYAALGKRLTAEIVFTSLALFGVLLGPINSFPWVINGIVEAVVSLSRLQDYLVLTPHETPRLIRSHSSSGAYGNGSVIENASQAPSPAAFEIHGSFCWDIATSSNHPQPHLQDIDLCIPKRCFTVITGDVGSGKSSLLQAILGEMSTVDAAFDVAMYGEDTLPQIAFASQDPWIMIGTIRSNILMGAEYDHDRYQAILHACALLDDVSVMAAGDKTPLGDGGAGLSGGQKARVALARALYRDVEIYLLDDILASVDGRVAAWILEHALYGDLVRCKTVVMVSHLHGVLDMADIVVKMDGGRIKEIQYKEKGINTTNARLSVADNADAAIADGNRPLERSHGDDSKNTTQTTSNEQIEEQRARGHLHWSVYKRYIDAASPWVAVTLIALLFMQATRNGSDLWLSYWVSHTQQSKADTRQWASSISPEVNYYLKGMLFIALANSLATLARAFAFAQGGLVAAKRLHRQLLTSVLTYSPLFFDQNPLGRTLNRFSSDSTTVDDSLPFIANIFLAQAFGLLGVGGILCFSQPVIAIALALLAPWYLWLQRYYRQSARELRRLDSIAKSPVYSTFATALDGGATIRAFHAAPCFLNSAHDAVAAQQRASLATLAASTWLGLRLQLIAAILAASIAGIGVFVVLDDHKSSSSTTSFVGLSVTYALPITGLLNGLLTSGAETEQEMVAVERIAQYIDVPAQSSLLLAASHESQPIKGSIQFQDVYMRYSPQQGPFVLKGCTFTIQTGENVGIVGRTGAGKSSIVASLLRLTEISRGSISIGNVDIRALPLKKLRKSIGYVPQAPLVFSGTLRENVDPLSEATSDAIVEALGVVDLWPTLEAAYKRLGGAVLPLIEGGEANCLLDNLSLGTGGLSLSQGQQQLLCLARVVLKRPGIVLLDEASASVDPATATSIQEIVRKEFMASTVMEIAHRLHGILDCDRVLVIDDGVVVESGSPEELCKDDKSLFADMLRAQQGDGRVDI